MSFIEFESTLEKDKKRQWEREARAATLEKAKNKYENEKLQEEARRQRGEHTWMLPSVEAKLTSDSSSKKKKKKEKKKKKKKAKKKKDSSSSSSSDSDENEKWVEKPSTSVPEKSSSATEKAACVVAPESQETSRESAKRDGWMEMTSLFKTYSRNEVKERDGTSRKLEKEEEKRKKQEADKPGSHARELNPYFKNGGTGLPEEEKSKSSPLGLDAAWLRRALQRAKEQSQQEKRPLEEIAAQRWGSLEKFNELLAQAEGRTSKKSGEPWQKNEQWRRNQNISRNRERERSRSRERKRSRSRERKRSSRSRSKERKSSRSGEKRSSSRDRNRSRSRDRNRSKSRDRKRSRSRERNRDGERNRSHSREKRSSKSRERARYRKRSDSSSSSDGSSDSYSSSSSRERKHHYNKKRSDSYKNCPPEMSRRSASGSMRPPGDNLPVAKSSALSSKFCKPQEDLSAVSHSKGVPSSIRGWQKKDYAQGQNRFEKPKPISSPSSSSSSPESSDEELNKEPLQEGPAKAPPESIAVALTDKEMNELAAKIMKAELIGNDGLATKLKNKLEAARTARVNAPYGSVDAENETGTKEEVVVLTRTDARGFSRPVTVTEAKKGRKKPEKMMTHDTDGQRTRYFPDDDKYDLKQMFETEKITTAEDQNSMFNRAAMRNTERLNEEYDLDDMFMSKAIKKENSEKQAERDRKTAIQEHRRSQSVLDSCHWCFENKEMAKHLIVALGKKAYLCLPNHESLTPGHCLIVPVHHVMCAVQADEDLWCEVQSFRKSLVKMFSSRDEDCIFFESVKRLRNFPHMVINCVPLPKETGDMAPIYFKKAIMECEAEWAQNKKLVDLKNRDVRKAVPKGLPYFFVDFAMDPGYAHVIEDEQDFPHNFAQEIVGGMLDLDNNLWRKPRKENFDAQRRKVMEFSRWYKEFDITQDDD